MKNKFDVKGLVRPCCECFQPYIAGKPIETVKRELGLKRVIKLASNENPLGPSKKAMNALQKTLKNVYLYPDSNSWELKDALSKKFGVTPENVVVGAGSDEIIELLAKTFFSPGDEIVVSKHAFIRYKMAGDLMGCGVKVVPMRDFKHDLNAMLGAVTPATKAIFIANPNNPTGTYNSAGELDDFLEKLDTVCADRLPFVVFDEAYYEYARAQKDYPETLKYLNKYPNIVVLRTFSKIFGLAGLRVGYGFASAEIAGYIDRVRPPFNINILAQAAAVACLNDYAHINRSVKLVEQQKKYLCRELDKLGLEYLPSAANFVLVNFAPRLGRGVFKELLCRGIIVRAMDEYELPNYVRITVGLKEENRILVDNLASMLGKGRKNK